MTEIPFYVYWAYNSVTDVGRFTDYPTLYLKPTMVQTGWTVLEVIVQDIRPIEELALDQVPRPHPWLEFV